MKYSNTSQDLTFTRMWQLPIAALCLAVPISALRLACNEPQDSAFLPLAIYGLHVFCAAAIMTLVALRLYTMHGVQRYAFDIGIWFLVAALLALPLGAAHMFASWVATAKPQLDARVIQAMRPMLAACFYLELIPVFFMTEGLMTLAASIIRNVRSWRITGGV